MADYKLSYTGDQTDEALGKAMKAVLTEAQNLTEAQQEQVRKNIGASVTADNIQAALGYVPVKDVQMGGTSVLADGVANVPIASVTNIDSRASKSVITPGNIDYAVKAAMCDGKGAAWTASEQKAARERIGMDGKYVLIEETTLTEETAQFERKQEPDGTPYNFEAIKVIVKFVPGQASGAFFCFGKNNGIRIVGGASQTLSMPSLSGNANFRSVAIFDAKPAYGGFYNCEIAAGSQGSAMAITRSSGGAYTMTETSKKIQSIAFYLYNNTDVQVVAGTEIAIYGVRA